MFRTRYGDDPLHLFAQIVAIALAGNAASRVPLESDVWWPLILRHSPGTFFAATGLTPDVYLGRWLGISGVFVLVSAVLYAVRVRRASARTALTNGLSSHRFRG
jgi:hypothetical protein